MSYFLLLGGLGSSKNEEEEEVHYCIFFKIVDR